MFKKNSMEFFVGLQPHLYYYYSGCTLKSHDHMFFPECSMITWPCHVILTYWVPTLFIFLLHCMLWGFGLSVQMRGKPFPVWGSHNIDSQLETISGSVVPSSGIVSGTWFANWVVLLVDYLYLFYFINLVLKSYCGLYMQRSNAASLRRHLG